MARLMMPPATLPASMIELESEFNLDAYVGR